ncbi:phage holin family protein [Desulfovibrio sp. ZJ369]|uniref:phage holin family protein n=1 Tax=Desulfovibrio sp. ZJ369 TaxID=2709793 RepID=UPI0013ECFD13|nr:phage holin family protein [Desulfovibrio sp. ZJ369]
MPGSVFDGLADIVAGIVVPLLLSAVATCVRLSRFGWKGVRHLMASLFASTFTGVIVFWGLDYFDLSPTVDAAIISVCAYMGGSLLDAFAFRARQVVAHGHLERKL